jgi:hypothetical protein
MVSGGLGSATAVDSSISLSERISATGIAPNPDGLPVAVAVSNVLLVTAAVVGGNALRTGGTLGTDDLE